MKFNTLIKHGLVVFIVAGLGVCGWLGYKKFFAKSVALPFKTQKAERRNVYNTVQAEGILEVQGTSKVGPLVTGTIKKIFVTENQDVKKGQLLALIDNGFGGNEGDSRVVQQKALFEQAKSALVYMRAHYGRQAALYKSGQLSKDAFEMIEKDYHSAKADFDNKQALYQQELYAFSQTKVRAPHDGTILAIPVKEGELVSMVSATSPTLFKIAKDLGTMKVILTIDEGKIGDIKIGQLVNLTVDTYPYRVWKGEIETIGKDPAADSYNASNKTVCYKTEFMIKDPEHLLRPGMTVHAKIKAGKAENVVALPGFVFQFSQKTIEATAKVLGYICKPLDPIKKKELTKDREHPHKFVWVVDDKVFIEKAVEVGLSDNAFYEIRSGNIDNEAIVFDVVESDEMKEMVKKWVGGGL